MKPFLFKPLCESDIDLLYSWFQNPTVIHWYGCDKHWSLEDIKQKYLPRIRGEDNIHSFIAYKDNCHIGFIQYYVLSEHLPDGILDYNNGLFAHYSHNQVAGIDCFIGEDIYRWQGLGAVIINDFITEFLINFRTVIVDPAANNVAAIRCYKKAAFMPTIYSEDAQYIIMIKTMAK